MMETEFFQMDLNIFAKSGGENHTSHSIKKHILLSQQLKKMKNEMNFIISTIIAQVLHNAENKIQIKTIDLKEAL